MAELPADVAEFGGAASEAIGLMRVSIGLRPCEVMG